MISPSPEAIAADALLAVHAPSYVKRGMTADGFEWVAVYTGDRGAFRVDGFIHHELLSHDRVDALRSAAPSLTIWELRDLARRVA